MIMFASNNGYVDIVTYLLYEKEYMLDIKNVLRYLHIQYVKIYLDNFL